MSLPSEPAFSKLKNEFVCGTRDISGEPYCGVSGEHDPGGQAIKTTNGAGPHNMQLFVLAPDGTVLHCLPGYWSPRDLAYELDLGKQLYQVWKDPRITDGHKSEIFRQAHLSHISHHPPDMVMRSRMQGFDQKFEARWRPYTSDTVKNPQLAVAALNSQDNRALNQAFKTTDQIMHERLSVRPLVRYEHFDVAAYSDYGRQKYEKKEDMRDMAGRLPFRPDKAARRMHKRMKAAPARGV